MEIDLTNSELFKSFAEFEKDGLYIDLHNEFDCIKIAYSSAKKQFMLSFEANQYRKGDVRSVSVIFDACTIEACSLKLGEADIDATTLDNMYRGRFEVNESELSEVSDSGMYYYYLDFLHNAHFELFARNVKAVVL